MAAAAAAITEKFVRRVNAGEPPAVVTTSSASAAAATASSSRNNNQTCSGNNGVDCNGCEEVVAGVEDHQQKFPIWVGVNCKLVSGIHKSTTCHDLISSIVPSSQDPSKYILVEKWKKMERILDPSVKILKVWKAWGDQIGDVSFILRSSPTADGYIDKKSSRKVHRKRSSSYHSKICQDEEHDKEGHHDAMEQLIKLVITQGEAIQAQLKKLRLQEEQIERYEEKMHKIRTTQLGENYVVDTYLKDDAKASRRTKHREKSPCKRTHHGGHHYHHHHHHHHCHRQKKAEHLEAGPSTAEQSYLEVEEVSKDPGASLTVTTTPAGAAAIETNQDVDSEEATGASSETIREETELMENIFQLNLRLTQEEERLVKLGLKIRKLTDKQRKAEWEELAVQDITQELEQLKLLTNDQNKEIESNERDLTALEQMLDDKHDHIAFLTQEIQLVDEQSEFLQRKVLEATASSSSRQQLPAYHEQQNDHPTQVSNVYHPQQLMYASVPTPGVTETILPPEQRITQLYEGQNPADKGHVQIESTKLKDLTKSTGPLYKAQDLPVPNSSAPASSVHYQCQQQPPLQDTCSSSCSNTSSVCVPTNQSKQSGGNTTGSTDPQDNDSNSDTGISSLHSSVDESPMYVLDTLV